MKHVMEAGLDALKEIDHRITYQPSDAFSTVETVSDFQDVIELCLSGFNVGCQPIAGTLAGMMRPTRIEVLQGFPQAVASNVITRIRETCEKPSIGRNDWNVKAKDNPASIAKAFARIVECASSRMTLCVDLSQFEPIRGRIVAEAFTGFCALLNHRAHRILSHADIADLLEWAFVASEVGTLDIQAVYGSPSYGAVLRRENDTMDVTACRPARTRTTRSLVAHVQPARETLDAILIHAASVGASIGLINGHAASTRVQGFRGTSPNRATLLPNHGTILNADLDLSRLAEADQWQAVKLASRSVIRGTESRLPEGLQEAWQAQADFRRFGGLCIYGVQPTRDHRNHALHDAVKEADRMTVCQPKLVTTLRTKIAGTPIERLRRQQDGLAYADHNAALDVPFTAMDVPRITDWLTEHWNTFVGANFLGS